MVLGERGNWIRGPRLTLETDPVDVLSEPFGERAFPEFAPPHDLAVPARLPLEVVVVDELGDAATDVEGALVGEEGYLVGLRSTDDPRCWVALRLLDQVDSFERWDGAVVTEERVSLRGGVVSEAADDLDLLFDYISGRSDLPRAVAAVFAVVAALAGPTGSVRGTLDQILAGQVPVPDGMPPAAGATGLGRAFLSPRAQDRATAAFDRPSWYLVHEVLARDRCREVREMLAGMRGELHGDAEEVLLADPDPGVRAALATEVRHRSQATVDALLYDVDVDVALTLLSGGSCVPDGLDLSAASLSPHTEVRRAVACRRDHLDDDALDRLRGDDDPAVAAAASVQLRCRSTVTPDDDLAHVVMWDAARPSTERLDAALSTVHVRNRAHDVGHGAEIDHAWCVVAVVADVVSGCSPDDVETARLAAQVVRSEFDASKHQTASGHVNEFGTGRVWREWLTETLLPAGAHLKTAAGPWGQVRLLLAECDGYDY